MTSMTSCIVRKKIRAMGPGPFKLHVFPFVVLAILMAMVGGISEHMLTSWSSCTEPFIITLPLSGYNLNNVERDVKTKTSLTSTVYNSANHF